MFDLNKTSTPVEEANPQDSGTEKKLHIHLNSATSAEPKMFGSFSRNYKFDQSELARLLTMDLPNDHPGTPNLVLNSDHARLPPHTSAFSEAPATAWRGTSSAVPKHLAMVPTAAGDGAPAIRDVIGSPLFKHGRVVEVLPRNGAGGGLFGNQNPASQCQTTVELDSPVVSDGESDGCWPRNPQDNSNSQALLVEPDNLPDEISVDPQFPWSPVHQEEAPFHSTLFRMSPENLQVAATIMLPPMSLEKELRVRELAFNASFKLETQRCTPTARCRSCLAFCQMRLPKLRLPSCLGGCGPGGVSQLREESPPESPPEFRNIDMDGESRKARQTSRHGPKSKSSAYRGVTYYKRTGRWEAHIWHQGAQTYLGASRTKEEAARTYDQAALLLFGPDADTNFTIESYKMEIAYLYKLSKEQLVIYLRRDCRGFGAQAVYPEVRTVKHVKNFYQATFGPKLLGTFAIEEDAARAVYKAAVRNSYRELVDSILDTHHVRNMPSYAAQRFAALYPEAVEAMQQGNQAKAIFTSMRPSVPPSSPQQHKKRLTRQAIKPNQDSTSPPAAATAIAASPHPRATYQLPGNKVKANFAVSPSSLTTIHSWDAYLAPRTRHQHAACANLIAAQHLQSRPHQPSNGINTLTPQQMSNLLPKFVRRVLATTASSSSCEGPSAPSIPGATGEGSSSGVIKFKLFNVEISVPVDTAHDGDWTEAHGESEPQVCDQPISPPRKRCKITGAAAPATPNPNP